MITLEVLKPRRVLQAIRNLALMPWPEDALGSSSNMGKCNGLCWTLLVAGGALPWILAVLQNLVTRHGVDFVYFYGVGKILNTYPADMLYDYGLQLKVFNAINPMHEPTYGPSPYPPFVALFFTVLARLSFNVAYIVWMGISLALYIVGITALLHTISPVERYKVNFIIYSALAFYPFLILTLANGQLASIVFCFIGVAISLDLKGRRFESGLALSIVTYKPTLLLLVIPMLLLTRRLRVFVGFLTGAVMLSLGSAAFLGVQIWPAYYRLATLFQRVTNSPEHFVRWQLVDLNSFFFVAPGGRSAGGLLILIVGASAITIWLVRLLWNSASDHKPVQLLTWATTLTWTLLLNVYVPMYDSVLVIIAIFLTLAALRDLDWIEAKKLIATLAVLIFASSYFSGAIAKTCRVQLMTILLLILGLGQAILLNKATSRDPAQTVTPA